MENPGAAGLTVHAGAAAAVVACTLCASMGGLSLAPFPDGGLELAWSDGLIPSTASQAGASEALFALVRGVLLSGAAVSLLTVAVLVLGRSARSRSEAATRAALGASPAALVGWIVRRELTGAMPWLGGGAVAGGVLSAGARWGWPGQDPALFPGAAVGGAALAALAVALLVALCAVGPLSGLDRDLRAGMGASSVLPRYPAGLRWLLPAAQLSITGGLLTLALVLVQRGGDAPRAQALDLPSAAVARVSVEGGVADRWEALRELLLADGGDVAGPAGGGGELRDVPAESGGPGGARVAATPGAFLGLGPTDLAMAECGRCFIGLMYVPLQGAEVRHHAVSPDTFRTLGIPVIEGREFTWDDDTAAPPVAMVNRAFARANFTDGGPLGRHVRLSTDLDGWYEVVGVVDQERLGSAPGASGGPAVYLSALQHPPRTLDVFAVAGPGGAAPALPGGEELGAYLSRHLRPVDWLGRILLGLGAWTVAVALIGTLSVMAFVASRRRRELALRAALGAGRASLVARTVAEVARVLGVGVLGGVWVTTGLLGVLGVVLGDPGSGAIPLGVGALGSLFVMGLAGALLVAVRVVRLEPRAVLDRI